MIFEATSANANQIDVFLARHNASSMFLRGNLRHHGIGRSDHPHATRMFIEEIDGKIAGIGGLTNNGMLMIQAPDGVETLAVELARVAQRDRLAGIVGASDQVTALSSAMGLDDIPVQMDDAEPLFTLALNGMITPDITGLHLRAATHSDLPLVADWRYAYVQETMGMAEGAETRTYSDNQADMMIETGNYRLLERDGDAVCFTGFNAALPDVVQIGGVFTPPQLRSNGLARTAVAMHLAEAQTDGVTDAVLFASGEPAARAYRGIGFQQVGHFTIKIFKQAA